MKKHLNLKTTLAFLFVGAFLFLNLVGCSKDDNDVFEPLLKVSIEDSRSVSNQPNEYQVDVLSNMTWNVKSDVDWIIISNGEGAEGKNTFTFSVEKNIEDERTATITITASDGTIKEFKVIQESGLSGDMFVKVGGTGEGRSWDDATSLANALEKAPSGSTIFIAAGKYVPTKMITNGNPDDPSDLTFEINKYITLKGGFPENPSAGASADPKVNKTLLSGEISDGIEAYHVVTVTAPRIEGQKVVIDGLTISHGNGFDRGSRVDIDGVNFARGNGGGMSIGNAIVDVLNTDIINNKTSGEGSQAGYCSGVFVFSNSYVTFRNCKINDNPSSGNGGGLYVDRSVAYVYDSEISRNSGGTGPGVYAYPDAEVYMYNTTLSENKGTSYGAAFYVRRNSKGLLVNCLIEGNESTSPNGGGGIMMYDDCKVDVISSTIVGNKIAGPGGGVYRRLNTNELNIYNSIISGNVSVDDGPDLDVFEENAMPPAINSSVIGSKVYNQSGSEITDISFNFSSMLNASFTPVGTENPAIDKGMSVNELNTLKNTFTPPLEDLISGDLKLNSRSGLTTMGAIVK